MEIEPARVASAEQVAPQADCADIGASSTMWKSHGCADQRLSAAV